MWREKKERPLLVNMDLYSWKLQPKQPAMLKRYYLGESRESFSEVTSFIFVHLFRDMGKQRMSCGQSDHMSAFKGIVLFFYLDFWGYTFALGNINCKFGLDTTVICKLLWLESLMGSAIVIPQPGVDCIFSNWLRRKPVCFICRGCPSRNILGSTKMPRNSFFLFEPTLHGFYKGFVGPFALSLSSNGSQFTLKIQIGITFVFSFPNLCT